MRIFCIANNKGGVTKTTTTINLAYGLARKGKKVLVVDTDAQSNTTYSILGDLESTPTLADLFFNGTDIKEIIKPTKKENLFIVPSSINLSAADLLMASASGREQKLKRALKDLHEFDFIIIDTPPNLGLVTINALVACTDVIIPIALTTYALIGIGILEQTMQELVDNLDISLPILGVIACLDDHTNMSNSVLNAIRDHFNGKLFSIVIPRNIKVEEAHNQTSSIFDYAPESTGAVAYDKLCEEVLNRVN